MSKTCEAKRKREALKRRHIRVRKKISGTADMPRLSVFRSNKHIAAQIINDENGNVLCAVSTLSKIYKEKAGSKLTKSKQASEIGTLLGKVALGKGINNIKFDKGGYQYHGRVKALATAVRDAGLKF